MKLFTKLTLSAAALTLLTACEDELDFQYHDIEPLKVIEGTFTQEWGGLKITLTTPMDEPLDTTPLTDADVAITDLTEGTTYQLTPDAEGIYRLPQGIVPLTGHEYAVDVTTAGQHFKATSTMLPPTSIDVLEFSWIAFPGTEQASLQVGFPDPEPGVENYYFVKIYRNDRTFTWSLARDIYMVDGLVRVNFFLTDREPKDDATFYDMLEPGDVVKAEVYPVDLKMFDYLMSAAMPGKNMIDYFSGDKCLGYFLTAPVASQTIVYDPEKIDLHN